jgi:hypothetical protein
VRRETRKFENDWFRGLFLYIHRGPCSVRVQSSVTMPRSISAHGATQPPQTHRIRLNRIAWLRENYQRHESCCRHTVILYNLIVLCGSATRATEQAYKVLGGGTLSKLFLFCRGLSPVACSYLELSGKLCFIHFVESVDGDRPIIHFP